MSSELGQSIKVAIGPNGALLRLEDLPPPDTRRWVARRKAEVVSAVQAGLLSFEDACRRYNISGEEFETWQAAIRRHGVGGLRVTQIQVMKRRDDERSGRDGGAAGRRR